LKGSILEIHPDHVQLKIWNKALDESFFVRYVEWAVEPNLMENSYAHQFASLTTFLGAMDTHKRRIYGILRPRFEENFKADYSHILSESQNEILNRALSARDYFLLQGPPGTGKTSKMLRNMVHYLYHHTQERIVLLAFTNRATDEICEKVNEATEGNFIRLGNAEIQDTYYDKSLKAVNGLENMRHVFREGRVFVSTVASFYRYINLLQGFDTLIIDEASQLLEPALVGILPNFKRFILIGDEKQLPAVVTQPMHFCKVEHEELKDIGIDNLSHSLFERLLLNAQKNGWYDAYTMLNTQYRTHEDIAQFISREFYKTLQIGSSRQQASFTRFEKDSPDAIEAQLAKGRLQFWASPQEPHFKFHQAEATAIVQTLHTIRRVYGADFKADTVGVITPYRAQMAEIFKQLDEELRYFVTVDTVERYQGSERDIILISMAVNHRAQMRNLQALNHDFTVDKKLNVALSRAREQLIIIGEPNILQEGIFYKKLLAHIQVKGKI
jgi:DNA replication ATP-dependent helicase Dna2